MMRINTNRGSTLLLAILVMTTLGASVYVIGRVAVRTVKHGTATVSGEVAMMVADSAAEQGLWAHGRAAGNSGDCDNANNTQAGTNEVRIGQGIYNLGSTGITGFTAPQCRSYLLPQSTTITLSPNQFKDIYIIDPVNLDANPGYTKVTLTGQYGSATIDVFNWDGSIFSSLSVGTGSQNNLNLSPSSKYYMTINAGGAGFTVSVYSEPKGLPADTVTVRSIGQNPGVSRMWEVTGVRY